MFPTVEEHQGMARAAGADRMASQSHSPPIDPRRSSLNRYTTNGEVRHARPVRPEPDGPLNIVYWPNKATSGDDDLSHLDPSSITHLIFTSALVAFDGTVRLSEDDYDMNTHSEARARLEACKALKARNRHLRVFVSLGGSLDNLDAFKLVASNESLSRKFGHSLRCLASALDVEGIELDWSHATSASEAESFLKLTATAEGYLGQDYNGRSYQLCISIPSNPKKLEVFQGMRDANKLVDFINVRTFNLPPPVAGVSYHQAPIFMLEQSPSQQNLPNALGRDLPRQPSCDSTVRLLETKGVNLRKLTLGISCYGMSFINAAGPLQPCNGRRHVPYKDLPFKDAREETNAEAGLAYCVGGANGFTSYESPSTLKSKADFVKSRGMAGFSYSDGVGDCGGNRSLIRSGFFALRTGTRGEKAA